MAEYDIIDVYISDLQWKSLNVERQNNLECCMMLVVQ